MNKTQRFKRVAKPKLPISTTQPDDLETRPSNRSKALTIRVKPKPNPKLNAVPIPDLSFDRMTILSPEFYQIDALDLAPRLLGKLLRRDDVVLQITEVEAYRPNDSACHGRFGITARTAPVFGRGGHAYVYLCYGLHTMLNIVADKEGVGAAVLIRSCAPIAADIGVILRNGNGYVLMAASHKEHRVFEVDDIEALAALRGLQLILHLGLLNLILEGDSLSIVEAICSNDANLTRRGSVIDEIKSLLSRFNSFEVLHVGRQGNEAAHLLARHAYFIDDTLQWWHSCPEFIQARVVLDAAV